MLVKLDHETPSRDENKKCLKAPARTASLFVKVPGESFRDPNRQLVIFLETSSQNGFFEVVAF